MMVDGPKGNNLNTHTPKNEMIFYETINYVKRHAIVFTSKAIQPSIRYHSINLSKELKPQSRRLVMIVISFSASPRRPFGILLIPA